MPTPKTKQDQIYDLIEGKIKSGEWLEGDRLPSQAAFVEEYGFKYGPYRSALLMLKAKGLIEGRQGDGVYVTKSDISMTSEELAKKQRRLRNGNKT
jgi:DNA-binding GntR family transcriptional regulator